MLKSTITFNGERITYQTVMNQMTLTGAFRARGAHVNEDPARSGKKGVTSRADLRKENLQAHVEGKPLGISTTHDLSVARHFAFQNFDSQSLANSSVIHFFSHWLIPDEHKSYVPEALKGKLCATYEKECETVFHRCAPEEVYLGYASPNALSFRFSCNINFNPAFVDPKIVMWDSELHALFCNRVYSPYTEDFGPKLGGRNHLSTDFQLNNFEKGKAEFHAKYRKTAARFFIEHQQSAAQQKRVNLFFATYMPF